MPTIDCPRTELLKLLLIRKHYSLDCTMGELFQVDYDTQETRHICMTLEDASSNHKVYGETCIPIGTYKVVNTYSNRFKKILPLLMDVPGYKGIRIHSGNSIKDTLGCVLVGKFFDDRIERIWSCAEPLESIIKLIDDYHNTELEII